MNATEHEEDPGAAAVVIGVLLLVVVIVGVIVGLVVGLPAWNRYQTRLSNNQHRQQARLDALNDVQVNRIRIQTYAQQVKIAKQQADIRYQKSVGIKRAQDEISKTLTPLYVQEDEIDALKAIALSGRNATVIYVPIGADGRPIVQQTASGAPVTTVVKGSK